LLIFYDKNKSYCAIIVEVQVSALNGLTTKSPKTLGCCHALEHARNHHDNLLFAAAPEALYPTRGIALMKSMKARSGVGTRRRPG
jgi:hypothetical protein